MADDGLEVREATEDDVVGVSEIFRTVYGEDYPYQGFYDLGWLKKTVFSDDIVMLVAVDRSSGAVLGTASVIFDIGAHSDLIAEFGRLAVHPDARGRGVGRRLMEGRVAHAEKRIHVGLVENRCVHPFSQRISEREGFAPVGFLPMRHLFLSRESIALCVRHFGKGHDLRCNNPRVVPEVHPFAHRALANCGLPIDVIVDESSPPYPPGGEGLEIEELTAEGLPSLLRIERGRTRQRAIFGPMRLHYGFFKLSCRSATYLLARDGSGAIAGAVGFLVDGLERSVRVFEAIARTDEAVRFCLENLVERCRGRGTEYIEVDVSAHSPPMQRTLLELGFLPAAYVPAMVFHEVERLDVVKMVRLLVPFDLGPVALTERAQVFADLVVEAFERRDVRPRIAAAIGRMSIFEGLSEEQATRIAGVCGVEEYDEGHRLFEAGSDPERMFLLIDGAVEILVDSRAVGRVEAGESLGERSALTGEPRSACATAAGPVVAAVLGRGDLERLTRQRPDIAVVLYRNLAIGLGRKLQRLDQSVATRRIEHPAT